MKKRDCLTLFIPCILLLQGCSSTIGALAYVGGARSYSVGETYGQVLDADTLQPIPDAIVATHWTGDYGFLQSYTACYHVETARTDANGKYIMPAWSVKQASDLSAISNKQFYTDAFKDGYIAIGDSKRKGPHLSNDEGWGGRGAKLYLVKFEGSNDEYFKTLYRSGYLTTCGEHGARNTYKLNHATLKAMEKIAHTDEQKEILKNAREDLTEDRVNRNKPTKQEYAITINIDPNDNYTEEELLK